MPYAGHPPGGRVTRCDEHSPCRGPRRVAHCVSGAAAADGDLRIGSPQAFDTPNPFQAVEAISVEAYATMYYDQLGGIRMKDQSGRLHNALAKGVDVSRGRQDDHVPPAQGHPLVGRQAVHERRRALDVQRGAEEQDEPAARGVPASSRSRRPTRTRSCCTSRRATRSSSRSSRCRSCRRTSGRRSRSPSSTRSTGRSRRSRRRRTSSRSGRRTARRSSTRNPTLRPLPQRRQGARGQAHPDHVLREPRLDLPRRQPGQPGLRLQRPADLGARARRPTKNLQLISAPRGGYWEIAFNSCPPKGSPICSGPGKGVKVKVVQDPAIRKRSPTRSTARSSSRPSTTARA